METTPHDEPAVTTAHLPQPRGRARWRWSTPGRAAVAGGTMAAVLGLGAGVAGATSTRPHLDSAASTSARPRPRRRHGRATAATRPTVAGRITALSGNAITLRTRRTTRRLRRSTTRPARPSPSLSAKGTTSDHERLHPRRRCLHRRARHHEERRHGVRLAHHGEHSAARRPGQASRRRRASRVSSPGRGASRRDGRAGAHDLVLARRVVGPDPGRRTCRARTGSPRRPVGANCTM